MPDTRNNELHALHLYTRLIGCITPVTISRLLPFYYIVQRHKNLLQPIQIRREEI